MGKFDSSPSLVYFIHCIVDMEFSSLNYIRICCDSEVVTDRWKVITLPGPFIRLHFRVTKNTHLGPELNCSHKKVFTIPGLTPRTILCQIYGNREWEDTYGECFVWDDAFFILVDILSCLQLNKGKLSLKYLKIGCISVGDVTLRFPCILEIH